MPNLLCLEQAQASSKETTQNLIQPLHHAHILKPPDTPVTSQQSFLYAVNSEMKYNPSNKGGEGMKQLQKTFFSPNDKHGRHTHPFVHRTDKSYALNNQIHCLEERKVCLSEYGLLSGGGEDPQYLLSMVPVCYLGNNFLVDYF